MMIEMGKWLGSSCFKYILKQVIERLFGFGKNSILILKN